MPALELRHKRFDLGVALRNRRLRARRGGLFGGLRGDRGLEQCVHPRLPRRDVGELRLPPRPICLQVLQPQLALLDEPLAALDPALREYVWHHALRGALSDAAVVLSTSDPQLALLADKVLVLHAGRAVQCAPPAALAATPGAFADLIADSLADAPLYTGMSPAVRPAASVTPRSVTSKAEPMTERVVMVSPTEICPLAWSDARCADDPVPQGLRSRRPGGITVAVRVCPSAPACRNIT